MKEVIITTNSNEHAIIYYNFSFINGYNGTIFAYG